MRRAAPAAAVVALVAGVALAAPDLENGREVYDKYCAQCHGINGDGVGHATNRVKPVPRDFTPGKYKFRSTPSGMLPTDADLARVVRQGLPYTSMPAWPNLSDAEVQNVVGYLKSFSDAFGNPEKVADPIDIPDPPATSEDSIARGRVVYEEQGCAACHGELGRGDGLSAPTLTDDWGNHLRPADMTQRWTFRGGPTRKDMFRTFSTGLNGTPMPSYADSLEVEDRWHLVNYMVSLGEGDDPGYDNLLRVPFLPDDLDLAQGAALFEDAPVSRFPVFGQVIEPGRNFYPSSTSVEVQAVYNQKEIAFLVRWNDMRAETTGTNAPDLQVPLWDEENAAADPAEADDGGGEDDFWGDEVEDEGGDDDFWGEEEGDDEPAGGDREFTDAVALQFPKVLPTGAKKPYFIFGDIESPVDLWFVDLARQAVQQFEGRGRASVTPAEGDEFEIVHGYDRGEWSVLLKRSRRSSNVSFAEAQFVPLAFSVWDGFNRERGNKRALSAWFHLYLEPRERVSAAGPMIKAGLGVLLAELLLIFAIRRRYTK